MSQATMLFLAIALLVTWPLQIPVFLGWVEGPAALAMLFVAGFGPTIAATVLTRGRVWRRLGERPRTWLILAGLLGPTILVATAALVDAALGGPGPQLGTPFWPAVLLPPLGEELGWRGYLQEHVSDRRGRGPVVAGLAVGAAWALWHLPTAIGSFDRDPMFALSLSAISLLAAWMHERGGRRLWTALALHAGVNLQLVTTTGTRASIVILALEIVLAVVVARSFRRGRAST
jgi:membrane protease YdiL (CAAX protease family)